ncbi:MAG: host specificity protein [Confluentimicrobium sp.]|uniref:baseplate multidomain protein megatron n=1 Tax=Actibacterium sp. TaxID=1872125 RepID=UPI000C484CC9|nr:glycoside hydrolase/phage tail family protein [Actibacterium sp.]MBC57799.1 host specificity protein [Actibacterium sp.]
MATIILSAAGAAVGSAIGGSVLGLSGVVIGRAVGATLGNVIDQKLLGSGSAVVEAGKVDRFRITGASEGAPVKRSFGRNRLSGQVIWSSRFRERTATSGGSKGAPEVTEFSYSVSLAIAICEGEISRLGRIWADGVEIARDDVNMRVYTGSESQLADPKMEAVEGAGAVPAYRGLAYVVFEDLALQPYGNRVPQFSFEVVRPVDSDDPAAKNLAQLVSGVALIPGTGEYALATTPVHYGGGLGAGGSANVNSPSGKADFSTSLEMLTEELPGCGSTMLVVSWFGDDLRCGACTLRPKVEQTQTEGANMPWQVSSTLRAQAQAVPQQDGRAVYGGTPTDQSVYEAIAALKAAGKDVVFYPFILMDQLAGNSLTDPWTGAQGQPVLPWRGRITTSLAPGVAGTPDQSAAAEAEVAAFFGTAVPGDFTALPGATVAYGGPAEWSYRRFILHYAHLCAAAGGVSAFCIGSEMRGLTQIRGTNGSFPAVEALVALATDVRAILGPNVKITYAADWSEYFGYHPQDGSGDVYFHLDPLWAAPEIDVIGIDNYMPLSDWRDGVDHADAHWGSIYALEYLQSNIEGGEGYSWHYASDQAAAVQNRSPITDGAHGEDWVFRYKDIRNWWLNPHHDRIGGVRQATPTDWVPQSKPVWFTEYGCAAVDKGTNQPNRFVDPKSSESGLPNYSTGVRDEVIQQQYLRAVGDYWGDAGRNPVSEIYGGPMIDMSYAHVWAWDARPFPQFPGNRALWSDGGNYARGHWLNGRASSQALAAVVREICGRSGVGAVDTSALYGVVRGYSLDEINGARAELQPLMLAYGFDAVEREGTLTFRNRTGRVQAGVARETLAVTDGRGGDFETIRAPEAETAGRVRLTFVEADADYETRSAEAIFPDDASMGVSVSDLPLVLTQAEGRVITERWLAESRVARDRARFALPPSRLPLGAGDVIGIETGAGEALYRIDRLEMAEARVIEAVRVEPDVFTPSDAAEERVSLTPFVAPVPVFPQFLDLPLLTGDEVEHAPHLAVTATPWPGSVAVYGAAQDDGYLLNTSVSQPSVIGATETALFAAEPARWDRGPALRVRIYGGSLASATAAEVLNGANAAAIGDGSSGNWEVFQFAEALLVGPDTYELRMRLRGQAGSDGLMPDVWPVGSLFVALNGAPQQIDLAQNARGLARHYRIGPAGRAHDDPSYSHAIEAFDGIGLRPYAPCHLRARRTGAGDLDLSWIRRTRIDGDSWVSPDVPLGEAQEQYLIRVRDSGEAVLREVTVAAPGWTYGAAQQAGDGVAAPYFIDVAQVSERFGAGLFKRIVING